MSRFDRPAASLKTDSQFVSFTTGARIFTAVKLNRPSASMSITVGSRRATCAAICRL